jgi:rRNA maturation protein Nop10
MSVPDSMAGESESCPACGAVAAVPAALPHAADREMIYYWCQTCGAPVASRGSVGDVERCARCGSPTHVAADADNPWVGYARKRGVCAVLVALSAGAAVLAATASAESPGAGLAAMLLMLAAILWAVCLAAVRRPGS